MPKFFMELGFKYGTDTHPYYHPPCIHGPYEDDLAVEHALAELYPNDKEKSFLVFDGQIMKVMPSPLEKPEEEKRAPGNMDNYIRVGGKWKCKGCGATILGAKVAHPIHFRAMPGAGAGECKYEEVPYCPNCEKKPDSRGAPVYYEDLKAV